MMQHTPANVPEVKPSGTTNRWSPKTENLLRDFDSAFQKGIEAYLETCQIMLEIAKQDDVMLEAVDHCKGNGGVPADYVTTLIHQRYSGRLSHAGISDRWTIAQNILKFIGSGMVLSSGITDTDVLIQAARYTKTERRNQYNQLTDKELAGAALEKFSPLNRDEARALQNPGGAAKLSTKPETTTAQGDGVYPTETVRAHHTADTTARETLNQKLEQAGETPLSPTLNLEMWTQFKTAAGVEILSAVKRFVESGATGEQGAALFGCYVLAEVGCDALVLQRLTAFMLLEHKDRTASNFLNALQIAVNERNAIFGVTPEPTTTEKKPVTDEEIAAAIKNGMSREKIKVGFGIGTGRYERVGASLAGQK